VHYHVAFEGMGERPVVGDHGLRARALVSITAKRRCPSTTSPSGLIHASSPSGPRCARVVTARVKTAAFIAGDRASMPHIRQLNSANASGTGPRATGREADAAGARCPLASEKLEKQDARHRHEKDAEPGFTQILRNNVRRDAHCHDINQKCQNTLRGAPIKRTNHKATRIKSNKAKVSKLPKHICYNTPVRSWRDLPTQDRVTHKV
jgi:hypothetical protein